MVLDSLTALLPGLLPASYRGIVFDIPDTSTSSGRRIAEHLFPGHDRAAYDDMGKRPEIVTVEGVIIGDDYVVRAQFLRRAFATRGPGTLMHPWLGALTVLLEDAGEVSFSAGELRVARVYASFKIVPAGVPRLDAATGPRLAADIATLATTVRLLIGSVGTVISAAMSLSVARSARVVRSSMAAAIASTRPGAVLPPSSELESTSVPNFASAIGRISAALTAALPIEAAVAPAAEAPARRAADPNRLFLFALDFADRLSTASRQAPSSADAALLAGAHLNALAMAAEMSAATVYSSRRDAMTARDRMLDAIGRADEDLDVLHLGTHAGAARSAAKALARLRVAVLADLNEAIGRLPRLVVVEARSEVSAFLIAQHLYGDAPELVEAGYEALIARNRHRHPAAMPAGPIEAAR